VIIHHVTATEIGKSDVFFIDLPQYLGYRWSIMAGSSAQVEDVARHKIADITGKGVAEFGITIDWE
jgi:hypothetical protein